MQHAVDMHRLHRRALQRGQQDAAQGVAERDAEAALERLRNHGGVTLRVRSRAHLELGRLDQFLPVLLDRHIVTHGVGAHDNIHQTRLRLRGRQPL
jgi:hypothetical protein